MTTRSGIVRVALCLAFLVSAFHAWADDLPSPHFTSRNPLAVEVLLMGGDAGIETDDDAGEAKADDSGSTFPITYGLSAGTFLWLPSAAGGITCHLDTIPSLNYRSRIFHPPIA